MLKLSRLLIIAAVATTTLGSPVAAQTSEPDSSTPADQPVEPPAGDGESVLQWVDDQNLIVEWSPYDQPTPEFAGTGAS
ncbi:hypothetical protein [Ilumatobacter sp.]|uniref:hypothetical protein n=1 Tax=Ilumatobacter sp. TaxID=1967498 RepID=UPI003C40B17E